MRASLQHRPLLCFACAFALGAAACGGWDAPLWLMLSTLAAGLALVVARTSAWPLVTTGLVLAGLACGALRGTEARIKPVTDVSRYAARSALATVTGVIAGDPEARPGRLVFRLRAEHVQTLGVSGPVSGDVYVSLATAQVHDRRSQVPLDYGDHVALRGYLDSPRAASNPGAFSWRDYLARQGVYAVLSVRQPPVRLPQSRRQNPFLRLAWATRRQVAAALKAHLPPADAAVLCGILIGQRADVPPALLADFVHTGAVHILASAGLHVGVLMWWLLAAARRLTLPPRWSALGVVAVLWLYAVMAGGRPSVTRAVLLATVYLAALIFEREPDLPTSLAFASLAILLGNPQTLFDTGFQMSFLTVATLAAAMPRWSEFWRAQTERRIANPFVRRGALRALELIGLTLFAQLGAAPIVAAAYNEVSLSGILANLLIVPALFLLIPLGFLTAALAAVSSSAAALGALLLTPVLNYIIAIVRLCGEAPGAFRAIPTPPIASIALYYAGVGVAARLLSRRKVSAPVITNA